MAKRVRVFDDKNRLDEAGIGAAFRAFGFIHRGGSRPRPLNARLASTNKQFAQDDHLFRTACNLAGIEPTKRQASKWRNKYGKAYSFRNRAQNG